MTVVQNGEARTILASAATTVIKARPGSIGRLLVTNVGTTMTIDIYDDPAAATAAKKVLSWVTADGKVSWELGIPMIEGITVVVGGTPGLAVLVWS